MWKVVGRAGSIVASCNIMQTGTKNEGNITPRAAVPMRKAALASTKVSQILRLFYAI